MFCGRIVGNSLLNGVAVYWGLCMSRQTCVLDRFEDNNIAVLEREDGTTFDIPAEWLPEDAQEGYVIAVERSGKGGASSVSFIVEEAATAQRLEEAKALRTSLAQAPEGDIEL